MTEKSNPCRYCGHAGKRHDVLYPDSDYWPVCRDCRGYDHVFRAASPLEPVPPQTREHLDAIAALRRGREAIVRAEREIREEREASAWAEAFLTAQAERLEDERYGRAS